MAGTNELQIQENEDSFQWDEQSQLYYHASSGFYHDPTAGWYYSSKDGLYYKFENGNYLPWETDQAEESNANQGIVTVGDNSAHEHAPCDPDTNDVKFEDGEFEGYVAEEATPSEPIGDSECISGLPENLPPPSEWLEDTLIELYLSNYSNKTPNNASDAMAHDDDTGAITHDDDTGLNIPPDGVENDDSYELEEGEWIPDDPHEVVDGTGVASDEDPFGDEEMWRAQYGQTIQSHKEVIPDCPVVDLWDWLMITETKKSRKRRICRLVGRLIKKSTKLHPSMPSSGRILKTAPICETHLDLVRVKSGRVYKLRSPKLAYLASLSFYDSLNPTKDWGFPELTAKKETGTKSSQHVDLKKVGPDVDNIGPLKEVSSSEKHKGGAYRDRAAERRSLHGGFGVGPGQKKSGDDVDSSSSPVFDNPEEAAAEALNMSFGVGSYARRMLENVGWKEGEALGSSMKGLTEPLQAVGNKGSSGLGWNHNSNRRHI